MWMVWRVLDGGITVEEAFAEAQELGLKTEAYGEKAADYIRRQRQ